MADSRNKRGLGRGLSSLMSDIAPADPQTDASSDIAPAKAEHFLPVEKLYPNPEQPRRVFEQDALDDLANSIRTKGIIQPLIVRKGPDDTYEIVAGERRWRASQLAGLHEVPVLIRDFSDTEVLEVAIVENIQRADLNPMDEAAAYRQLMDRFSHTQEDIATALGKSRSHIANLLRLMTLPESIQSMVSQGKLSFGHARTLVGHENADKLAQKIIAGGLSVRAAEKLVKQQDRPKPTTRPHKASDKDADTVQIEKELSAQLNMPIQIEHSAGKESGKLVLNYRNLGQLDDLLRLLSGN